MTDQSYRTKQRTVIINFLAQHPHTGFDIDSLFTALAENGEKVGRTTVYRTLKKLAAQNDVISYFDKEQKRTLFQYQAAHAHGTDHVHLKCIGCGKIAHLDCAYMESFEEHLLLQHQFRLAPECQMFSGLCADCAAAESQSSLPDDAAETETDHGG